MDKLHALLIHNTALGPLWVVLLTLGALPLANDLVQRAKSSSPDSLISRAQSLLQLICGAALSIPVVSQIIAKFPVVGDLLYIFAPQNKVNLAKPLFFKPKVTAGEIVASKVGPALVLFFVASTFVACVWGKAFVASEKTCQVSNIPAEKQQLYTAVQSALADPLNWEAELIRLATQYGEEQVDCLVMAVKAADSAIEAADGGVKLASVDRVKQTRIANANAWLKKHPGKAALKATK
jgi:hypothetical protein